MPTQTLMPMRRLLCRAGTDVQRSETEWDVTGRDVPPPNLPKGKEENTHTVRVVFLASVLAAPSKCFWHSRRTGGRYIYIHTLSFNRCLWRQDEPASLQRYPPTRHRRHGIFMVVSSKPLPLSTSAGAATTPPKRRLVRERASSPVFILVISALPPHEAVRPSAMHALQAVFLCVRAGWSLGSR